MDSIQGHLNRSRGSFRCHTLAPVTPPLAQQSAPTSQAVLLTAAPPTVAGPGLPLADDDGEPPSTSCKPSAATSSLPSPAPAEPTADRDGTGDAAAPLFSEEIGQGLGWLAGSCIALLTLLIPIGSVLSDRAGDPDPSAEPSLPAATARLQPTTVWPASSPEGSTPGRGEVRGIRTRTGR